LACHSSESTGQSQLIKVSLDDADFSLQVGCADPNFRRLEFLEELDFQLTPEERDVLADLLAGDDEETEPSKQVVAARIKEKARAIISGESEWILQHRACKCERVPQVGTSMFNTNKVRSAIKAGDTKLLEEMLPEGLDPNATLKQHWTLLHLAAKAGQASIVAFLLDRGARVNAQSGMRQTPLDVALNGQQTKIAELLQKHGGRKGVELSLHSAVLAGDIKLVKKHLEAGADINSRDRGELPLCLALSRHRWDVAALLLKKRADVTKRQENRNMALHEAAYAGVDGTVLKAILDLGADVNAVGCDSMTPLCCAASGGHEDAAKFLMQNEADVGFRAKDGTGPVSEAIHAAHVALARFFIDSGAKCSLHHAVQCDHLARARQLLSEGADVQEEDDCYMDSPMGVAIWNDSVEMVKLLMEFGASPNDQKPISQGRDGAYGGDTPLHNAVQKGSAKMVKLLLAHGADPDIQNAYRLSPVELAKRRDQTHLVNLMEKQIDRSVIGESVEQLLTIGKVAELLSVEEAFVTKLLADGKLRHVKLDTNITRIPASSLRKYITKLLK
jgi:excisionase family DNA binding protein